MTAWGLSQLVPDASLLSRRLWLLSVLRTKMELHALARQACINFL